MNSGLEKYSEWPCVEANYTWESLHHHGFFGLCNPPNTHLFLVCYYVAFIQKHGIFPDCFFPYMRKGKWMLRLGAWIFLWSRRHWSPLLSVPNFTFDQSSQHFPTTLFMFSWLYSCIQRQSQTSTHTPQKKWSKEIKGLSKKKKQNSSYGTISHQHAWSCPLHQDTGLWLLSSFCKDKRTHIPILIPYILTERTSLRY